eukprot:3937458-Rhodomonas_salina.1
MEWRTSTGKGCWNREEEGGSCNPNILTKRKREPEGVTCLVCSNCRCSRAGGLLELTSTAQCEVVIALPGARDQDSGLWARKAIALGGWFSFQEMQDDPVHM